MIRNLLICSLFCLSVFSAKAQYLENFTGQNGKGLVNAVCPEGTTNINNCGSSCSFNASDNTSNCSVVPVDLSGVTWDITATNFFTDNSGFGFEHDSPDDFGVISSQFQVNDTDQEICWVSPTLNISSAGTVTISVDVDEDGNLDDEDFIRAEYSLNGGGWVQFGYENNDFAAQTFTSPGISGSTLVIRICAFTDGSSEFIYFDNVRVPKAGVTIGCTPPVLSTVASPTSSCNPNGGAIQVTATGGTPGYNVAWSGPSSGNPGGVEIASSGGMYNITGLSVGTYTITVTDANSCTATTTAAVTAASAMSLSTQVTNASCAGDANGGINLVVTNGSAPYSYSWSNLPGSPDPEDQTSLAPGTYTVTVTDNAGCTATTSATVGFVPAGPYLETFSTPNKGYLTMMNNDFSGVNWTMTAWANGDRDANDYFRTNGGKLEGIDFDAEVCWVSPLLNISASGVVSISVDATWTGFDSGTPGDYIRLQYSVDGGAYQTVPNQFGGGSNGTVHYASGTGHNSSGTLTAGGISGNSLQIRICANFNSNDENITLDNISVPQTVTLACVTPELSINKTNVLCFGASTGALDLTVTDGKPPYTYSWSNLPGAPDPQDQTGLATGTYTVTVTDNNGVTATISATITQPATIISGGAFPSHACNVNDGAIQLTAFGGTPGYQVKWSGPSSGDPAGVEIAASGGMYNITGLTVGAYSVMVTDANGCAFTTFPTVNTAGCCMVSADAGINQSICPGSNTVIGGAPTGSGTQTLSYAWSPAAGLSSTTLPNPTASPASNTTYTVTVTSTAGCSATASVTVTVYDQPTASGTPTDPLCNGQNGKITMTLGGGKSPYDIAWDGPGANDGSTINKTSGYMIMNIPAGPYSITVTDDNGCTATTSATINQPPALTLSATPTDVSCPGDANGKITLTIGGGVSPYDIYWTDLPNGNNPGNANNQSSGYMISNLPAGDYFVSVTDENNCSKTVAKTTVGTANSTPVCEISDPMSVVCPNSEGNQYSASAGMDAYQWSISGDGSIPGSKTNQMVEVSAGASGSYTVTVVITKNGCTASCSKTVMIETIPFEIVYNSSYCLDDPGPVIGLNGSEMGASYRLLSISGTIIVDSALTGTGSNLVFGTFPVGTYQMVITNGTCDATLSETVNATVTGCSVDVPNYCSCNDPSGYAPVTVKVSAPPFQNWTVTDVIGLYGSAMAHPPVTVGTPLNYVGGNMYTLEVVRDNTKGYYVRVSNGFTEKDIQVGNPSW